MNSHVKEMQKNKHDVWPFPKFPAVPLTKQQEQAYQQTQRNKYEESPL